ncbi:hypothetical protein VNO77_18057 [Canavalia gladiata]|uniref:Pectinesterase n=1 Tax=Canavalia gladiata TaxID=3824 RepID=A0AAN9LKU4_CANGL
MWLKLSCMRLIFVGLVSAVVGDGFIAKGITFENSAGARKEQAVALRSGADLSAFYKCSFVAYQDTLYVHSLRQFYRDCDIYGTVDFIFGNAAVTYLGRPWRLYSRTVYLNSYMEDLIDPAGWSEWNGTFALDTLYYGEYNNGGRVTWPGYRVIKNSTEASPFTVGQFIQGNQWLRSTNIPFFSDLS